MLATSRSVTRLTLLTGIAFAMPVMSSKVLSYRPLLGMPGGKTFVFESAGLLIAYAVVVFWTTDRDSPVRHSMLLATPLGLIRCREVFWDCPIGKATTMNRHLDVVEQNCIG